MADNPKTRLSFEGRCPDCAERRIDLPSPLPVAGDDFDWMVRDFDSFRRFMLEELAARFPERTRWTPADMEVVLLEVLAAVLDQLSDMADRVAAEAFLETARRPESVRRLLGLIGYDAATAVGLVDDSSDDDSSGMENGKTREEKLERLWRQNRALMDTARQEGPRAIHTQRRMVTVDDYANRLKEHPLVLHAHAWSEWSGSWTTIRLAVILWNDSLLDQEGLDYPDDLIKTVNVYHLKQGLWQPFPENEISDLLTIRTVLRPCLDAYRMLGQEVVLQDVLPVGIKMSLSIRVADNFFLSEVRHAVQEVLGTGPGGFFEPGRLGFGEDLFAGDIFQVVMSLDGVENVCLNRFKRFGDHYPDQTNTGQIVLEELEIAVCNNDPANPERGFYNLSLHGGRRG
ncbi:MAG: hypothetical protein IMY82_02015 [Chloroflexi bacterium]|nr:hypothetical protein [Chloroflexota bacterium]